MASIVVELQIDGPEEKAKAALLSLTDTLETRGHVIRLADLGVLQTGKGRFGVQVAADDADGAAGEVQRVSSTRSRERRTT